jgi:hypothetical protein
MNQHDGWMLALGSSTCDREEKRGQHEATPDKSLTVARKKEVAPARSEPARPGMTTTTEPAQFCRVNFLSATAAAAALLHLRRWLCVRPVLAKALSNGGGRRRPCWLFFFFLERASTAASVVAKATHVVRRPSSDVQRGSAWLRRRDKTTGHSPDA